MPAPLPDRATCNEAIMLVLDLDGRSLEELMGCLVLPARAREMPAPECQEWLEEVAVRIAQSGDGGIS